MMEVLFSTGQIQERIDLFGRAEGQSGHPQKKPEVVGRLYNKVDRRQAVLDR